MLSDKLLVEHCLRISPYRKDLRKIRYGFQREGVLQPYQRRYLERFLACLEDPVRNIEGELARREIEEPYVACDAKPST